MWFGDSIRILVPFHLEQEKHAVLSSGGGRSYTTLEGHHHLPRSKGDSLSSPEMTRATFLYGFQPASPRRCVAHFLADWLTTFRRQTSSRELSPTKELPQENVVVAELTVDFQLQNE